MSFLGYPLLISTRKLLSLEVYQAVLTHDGYQELKPKPTLNSTRQVSLQLLTPLLCESVPLDTDTPDTPSAPCRVDLLSREVGLLSIASSAHLQRGFASKPAIGSCISWDKTPRQRQLIELWVYLGLLFQSNKSPSWQGEGSRNSSRGRKQETERVTRDFPVCFDALKLVPSGIPPPGRPHFLNLPK